MLLSGGSTPVESQPKWLQYAHATSCPSRHFVSFSQVIIYRGGGLERGLAAVPDGRRRRPRLLRLQPVRLPQVDRGEQVVQRGAAVAQITSPAPSAWRRGFRQDPLRPAGAPDLAQVPGAPPMTMHRDNAGPPWFERPARPNTCSTPGSARSCSGTRCASAATTSLEHERPGKPPVLVFDYETVARRPHARSGRSTTRWCASCRRAGVDRRSDKRRPYVIIDPRAGHGPGIGGFKDDSQVGVALRAGHPVYFVIFFRDPEPGQTLLDVCDAEQRVRAQGARAASGQRRSPRSSATARAAGRR